MRRQTCSNFRTTMVRTYSVSIFRINTVHFISFCNLLSNYYFWGYIKSPRSGSRGEALPGVWGNRGIRPFISGEQRNKSLKLKGTGKQRQFGGTGTIENQDFDFGHHEKTPIFFSGTREQVHPWESLRGGSGGSFKTPLWLKFHFHKKFRMINFEYCKYPEYSHTWLYTLYL